MMSTRIGAVVLALGVAGGTLGMSTSASQALTCSTAHFTTSIDCISPVPGGPGGNVTATTMNRYDDGNGAFGVTGWRLLAKADVPRGFESGDTVRSEPFLFSITIDDSGALYGTWKLNPLFTWDPDAEFAFALKGATGNAVYHMDKDFTEGRWSMAGLFTPGETKNNPGLSNIRLFGTDDLAPIPLPASVLMILGAIAAMLGVTRRRRLQAA